MNQSPSLLLFYVSRNHHFSIIHTFCKVPSLVGSPLSSISLIMMKLLLLHKSNPLFCPPCRLSLPGRAQPTLSPLPLTHLDLPPLIFPQPFLQSISHSHHNQITPLPIYHLTRPAAYPPLPQTNILHLSLATLLIPSNLSFKRHIASFSIPIF